MRVPLSWLREFVDIVQHPQQIARALTMLGLEVDGIVAVQPRFSNVVVAEVLSCEKHPSADSLTVAQVYDGEQTLQIVCGAPNCRAGIKTALARCGAILDSDGDKPFNITVATLRGVPSHGMLCSAKELGVGPDDQGIMEFASQVPVGADVAQMYTDTYFDISLTPNLGHCASIYGVARELAAAFGLALRPIAQPDDSAMALGDPTPFSVDITATERCQRYCCRLVHHVTVSPSPQWLQHRLTACGLRPINNIVDVTNYVMTELGQPLHAFDAAKVHGQRITVRLAAPGETLTTLDGALLQLHGDDLVIADARGPIALAGVIGGADTRVDEGTSEVLLECACFDPAAVRRTARRHGLATDAAARFEKGVDIEALPAVVERATALFASVSGGRATAALLDSYPAAAPHRQLVCRLAKVQELLGMSLGSGEVEELLWRQSIPVQWDEANELFTAHIPTHRRDLQIDVDLIEEIARHYGYDKIPRYAAPFNLQENGDDPLYVFGEALRELLCGLGLTELITCDLVGPRLLQKSGGNLMGEESLVRLLNPSSVDHSLLRTSLLPSLLQVAKHNIDRQTRSIGAFELGRIHFRAADGRYVDQDNVGLLLMGDRHPTGWAQEAHESDFYDMKGLVEALFELLHIDARWQGGAVASLHPGRQAAAYHGDVELGTIGEVHPLILQQWDIKQRIIVGEFNVRALQRAHPQHLKMQPLAQYPCSERDWTVMLDEAMSLQALWEALEQCHEPLLESYRLLGIYRGGKLPDDKKNITLRFVYRDKSKTIDHKAVEEAHSKVINSIEASLMRDKV